MYLAILFEAAHVQKIFRFPKEIDATFCDPRDDQQCAVAAASLMITFGQAHRH